jgi:uncharacterized protein YbaR (Trm112 family)
VYLLLTDRTSCPRCGPGFGLILLADRLDDRRVREGVLGCSNCRERYPIHEGVADLRPPPRASLAVAEPDPFPRPHDSLALTAAAASGVGPAGGKVLLVGAAASLAGATAAVVPEGVEIVTAQRGRPSLPVGPGVSPTVVGLTLPFFDATFAGVVMCGSDAAPEALREAARVLLRGHRVVLLDPPTDVQTRLGAAGLLRFVHGEGVAAAGR